jgi:2-polyprenyl-3-methyl-5-hydroxy-6-metoxy-1,4-benzoquinol methylase
LQPHILGPDDADTPPESVNAEAWNTYGTHHLRRGTVLAQVERIDWGFWGTGPGDEILGELSGRRVLDIGCGTGCFSKDGVPRRSCRFTPGPSF